MTTSSAVFSLDRSYRYELWRRWSEGAYCLFIGINPSTADETLDDPTIRRCIGFAKRWGFGALCMVNLFAYRATQPDDMLAASEPVGPDNNLSLTSRAKGAGLIIAAWGKHGKHLGRDREVLGLMHTLPCFCLRQNQDGSPSHPLYLPRASVPIPYNQ